MASVRTIFYFAVLMGFGKLPEIQGAIPSDIYTCYRNNSLLMKGRGLPLNVASLLDLIQKVEMNPTAALDLRTMAFTLLHKLQFDGIERNPNVPESEGVIPIAPSGRQYIKYSILFEKLVAGHDKFFPEGSLNDVEMCALHAMFSSTVDRWQRGDENSVCPHVLNSRYTRQANTESRCPIEGGVINSQWGTLSPSHVIGAIATSLELQQVRIGRLVEAPNIKRSSHHTEEEQSLRSDRLLSEDVEILENFQPQSQARAGRLEDLLSTEQEKYFKKLQELPETEIVTNTWAVTLAGDLSEVAVFQGQYGNELELGLNGHWNDTSIPRAFYLEKAGPWDMTNAEIVGGIDGLILASKVSQWTKSLSRLRLSQVLDMYYSDRGVNFNTSYRACQRKNLINQIMNSEQLLNETTNFARVLYFNSRDSLILFNVEEHSKKAADLFQQQLDSFLVSESCPSNTTSTPRVIVHLILDATWRGYEAYKLLGVLAEAIHVSRYGSSIGILAGRGSGTGWLVNTTNSYTEFMQGVANITTWSTDLDLPLSLTTLLETLHWQNINELQEGLVGGPSHVVLVLGYTATISDNDQTKIQQMLQMFRNQQRDVHFMYLTSSEHQQHFQSFVNSDTPNMDSVIVVENTNTDTVVNAVVEKMRQVPWRVMSGVCDSTMLSTTVSGEMEDYVTPGVKNFYRIHPDFLQGVAKLTLKFRGSGYGNLSVCWTREQSARPESTNCVEVSGHEESLLGLNTPCGGEGACLPLYFTANVGNSYSKCAEDDCRYPDQVRFTLLQEGLRCYEFVSNSSTALSAVPSAATNIEGATVTFFLGLVAHLFVYNFRRSYYGQ